MQEDCLNQTKITIDLLKEKGYKPHKLSGFKVLYEKDTVIVEIIPLLNIINIRTENLVEFSYPLLVKRDIRYWEVLEEYINEQSHTQGNNSSTFP